MLRKRSRIVETLPIYFLDRHSKWLYLQYSTENVFRHKDLTMNFVVAGYFSEREMCIYNESEGGVDNDIVATQALFELLLK